MLLVPDNGSAEVMSSDLSHVVNLWAADISVGAGSRDTAPETLAALEGYTVLRTGERGCISFATNGVTLWVETER